MNSRMTLHLWWLSGLSALIFSCGQVVKDMAIVRKIQSGPTDYQTLNQVIDITQIRKYSE